MTSTTTNNIKSWGDVSSDDDSDDDIRPPPRPIPSYNSTDDDDADNYNNPPKVLPQYTIPSHPPYTSYIGNISYDIRNTTEFCTHVQEMLTKRNVTGFSTARLMMDRDSDRSKGYGYIEFTSGKEVRWYMVVYLQKDISPFVIQFFCISFFLYD
jgi:RNA recognition motif-containing protein